MANAVLSNQSFGRIWIAVVELDTAVGAVTVNAAGCIIEVESVHASIDSGGTVSPAVEYTVQDTNGNEIDRGTVRGGSSGISHALRTPATSDGLVVQARVEVGTDPEAHIVVNYRFITGNAPTAV